MKEKTLTYRFRIKYLPGKKNPADYLSRYPALRSAPDSSDKDLATHIEAVTVAAVTDRLHNEWVALKQEDIQRITAEDPVYQMLLDKVKSNSWLPSKAQEAICLRPFYTIRE